MVITRRRLGAFLTGAGLFAGSRQFAFAASDFWNKKSKNEWSSDEIRTLTTKSPWAKEVRIEYRTQLRPNFDGTPGGLAMPDNTINNGSPPGVNAGARVNVPLGRNAGDTGNGIDNDPHRGINRTIPMEARAATIRWESAQPILDALKKMDALKGSITEDFEGHYIISVTGLPVRNDASAIPEPILRNSATLQAKGKDPAQPGVVRYTQNGATILFGFAKEFLPLTATDKDVQFNVNTDDIQLKVRFDPKEMIYRGQLAI